MTLRIAQTSRRLGPQLYQWAVWLEGPAPALDAVSAVIYTLHPTFPRPVRTVTERPGGFRLETEGWGGFELHARVRRSGLADTELSHWVTLGDGADGGRMASHRRPGGLSTLIASTLADAPIAEAVQVALQRLYIAAHVAGNAPVGSFAPNSSEDAAQRKDALVLVLTGRVSPQMREQADLFRKNNKPVLALMINDMMPRDARLTGLLDIFVKWDFSASPDHPQAMQAAERIRDTLLSSVVRG